VQTLLARNQVKRILLIPYAVIRSDWDARARELTESLGVDAISIHHFDDPVDAINRADAIFISGGNTWLLNQRLHGMVWWSPSSVRCASGACPMWAGAPAATWPPPASGPPTTCRCAAPSCCLRWGFPVQINPHYLDASISGHMGETRDERLAEFCAINPSESVVALREASLLQIGGNHIRVLGARGETFKIFKHGEPVREYGDAAPLAALTPSRRHADPAKRQRDGLRHPSCFVARPFVIHSRMAISSREPLRPGALSNTTSGTAHRLTHIIRRKSCR
jgi:dipeptidase E